MGMQYDVLAVHADADVQAVDVEGGENGDPGVQKAVDSDPLGLGPNESYQQTQQAAKSHQSDEVPAYFRLSHRLTGGIDRQHAPYHHQQEVKRANAASIFGFRRRSALHGKRFSCQAPPPRWWASRLAWFPPRVI